MDAKTRVRHALKVFVVYEILAGGVMDLLAGCYASFQS